MALFRIYFLILKTLPYFCFSLEEEEKESPLKRKRKQHIPSIQEVPKASEGGSSLVKDKKEEEKKREVEPQAAGVKKNEPLKKKKKKRRVLKLSEGDDEAIPDTDPKPSAKGEIEAEQQTVPSTNDKAP
jgi:hypothetical protein